MGYIFITLVRIYETNSMHIRKFDFDPHLQGKINCDNKHRMTNILKLRRMLRLNSTISLKDVTIGYEQLRACVCEVGV